MRGEGRRADQRQRRLELRGPLNGWVACRPPVPCTVHPGSVPVRCGPVEKIVGDGGRENESRRAGGGAEDTVTRAEKVLSKCTEREKIVCTRLAVE